MALAAIEAQWLIRDFWAGGTKQKGIITYGLSPNRQNPFAGAGHDAVFNTFRRFRKQVLYWAPPAVVAYFVMDWAVKKYGG